MQHMWAPLPDEAVALADHPYVVYYLFDDELEPVYIGRTANVNQRFAAHSCAPWWRDVAAFSLEFHRLYAQAYNGERQAILDHEPRLNYQRFEPSENPPEMAPVRPPREPKPAPRCVTTSVAARSVGMSSATLVRWVHEGRVRPELRTMGGHWRWNVNSLKCQLGMTA